MSKTITPADIAARKSALIERGKAHKILSECADSRRRERAGDITILRATESAATGALRAEVASATGDGTTYVVTCDGPRDGRIRAFSCTCRDHRDRGSVCKHLLAVSHRYVAQKRDEYKLLADIEKLFDL